ncbi:hypothetical protein B7C51_14260 [Paenibacillus larvae subsp. pulvifaciens]|uniref:Transposase IS116/IS110/IS902 C-terminal domain-containing protein n=1 Tax=Paenibacillus larvae subsp. pulvifaciens TaxID=1477 RepID=A0A1V0UUM1_9BACL|nr:hypothetical protein B7C51_14260 [Paenibacillus larvae subsp. pulvifaciens]
MAGHNLAESTSGKKKGQVVISKRGRRQLRKYLYLAVMNLVAHHPSFKEWHRHNVEIRQMKKQRSVFKLIGKLARLQDFKKTRRIEFLLLKGLDPFTEHDRPPLLEQV